MAARPRFETTCPACKTVFDVTHDARLATCPACQTRIRITDEADAEKTEMAPKAPAPTPAGRLALAVGNALAAPAVALFAVTLLPQYSSFVGLHYGQAQTMAGVIVAAVTVTTALVAVVAGLREVMPWIVAIGAAAVAWFGMLATQGAFVAGFLVGGSVGFVLQGTGLALTGAMAAVGGWWLWAIYL